MDPYKVLGVTPQTSDDDVKRAYRELARKYHPDNYVNNPLADLAETRMKEINEAYDMIMNERRNPAGGSSGRDAEWFYLTGTVYYRKGWYDEAARAYTQACQMDPNNAEYQHALQNLHLSGGYGGYRPMQETSMCDCCVQTLICNCCLNMCCGGGGC